MIEKIKKAMNQFKEVIDNQKDYLNDLDRNIGDGDHGSNMQRGMDAVIEKINHSEYHDLSSLYKDIGMQLVSKVGGASGALYGTAFIEMSKSAVQESNILNQLLDAFEGIKRRGQSDVGEKTMLDVWGPVLNAIQERKLTEEVIIDSVEKTKPMKATKGRASYLGERSIGHIDPGAQSSGYLFQSLLETGVFDE